MFNKDQLIKPNKAEWILKFTKVRAEIRELKNIYAIKNKY